MACPPSRPLPSGRSSTGPAIATTSLEFGALGPGVSRTGRIGAVVELADQLHRAVQSMEAAVAMIADVHHPPASWTAPIQDVEFPQGEIGVRRPSVRHPGELRDHEPAIDSRDRTSR